MSFHQDIKRQAANETRLIAIQKSLEDQSVDELTGAAKEESIHGIERTAAYVRQARDQEAENYNQQYFEEQIREDEVTRQRFIAYYGTDDPIHMARREAYAAHIRNLLALGWTAEDIRFQLENRKIWDTFTPHPTKDKTEDGQSYFDDNVKNGPSEKTRGQARQKQLTPINKDELADETKTGLDHLDRYMDGALDYLQDMQWALDKSLGTQTFDLRDTSIDVAPRDWYAGDADGKLVPAEVLFSKRLKGAVRGVEKYLTILESVPEEHRHYYQDAIDSFRSLKEALDHIETDPAKLKGDALKAALAQFSTAYTDNQFNGLSHEDGPAHTTAIMRQLRDVSENRTIPKAVRDAAERATLMHKQVGIALGRQEIRHSGDDFNKLFDNLYTYLAENPGLAAEIKIKKGSKLSDLTEAQQIQFYKTLMENHREQVKGWLYEANEGKLEGPTAEVLDRFMVVKETFNPRRMGVAIIAEANPMSCIQQQVLAESFEIKGLTHCALNETEASIKDAPKNLKLYLQHFGKSNLSFKMQEIEANEDHPKIYACVMDPASDSHKSWGIFMKGAQMSSWGGLINLGVEFGNAVLMKIGTGLSYARGGFPAEIVPRLQLNAICHAMNLKGLNEKTCKILKRQMSLVSTTIQGRGPGILRGSPEQVQDALAKIGFEIDGACLAIDGKIDPELIAPISPKYKKHMRNFLDDTKQYCRDYYHDVIRGLGGDEGQSQEILGEKIENRYLRSVSATMMALLTNVSARKASRSDRDQKAEILKDKDIDGQRAIGQNIAKEWSESLYDGWFTLGKFLSKTHETFNDNKIDRFHISQLAQDKIYTHHKWGNAMLALAKADLEWDFDKLAQDKGELSDERWTVGKLMEVVKHDFQIHDGRKWVPLDEEEKYHAQIAYEGILASSQMEAFLNTSEEKWHNRLSARFSSAVNRKDMRLQERDIILSVYNQNDTLEKTKFGPKTKAMYPGIDHAQKLAQEDKLTRAMVHEGERRLREKEAQGEYLEEGTEEIQEYRTIAMARRTQGPITMPNLMDKRGITFGARSEPIKTVLEKEARRQDRLYRIQSPANDPNPRLEHAA